MRRTDLQVQQSKAEKEAANKTQANLDPETREGVHTAKIIL